LNCYFSFQEIKSALLIAANPANKTSFELPDFADFLKVQYLGVSGGRGTSTTQAN